MSREVLSTPAAYSHGRGSGILVFAKVALMLAVWVVGFIAFLMAPLFLLAAAWIVGLAILALRHRSSGHEVSGPPEEEQTHRFGAYAAESGDETA